MSTWKILGADTKKPKADDKVAAKIPMVIKWPDPETVARIWRKIGIQFFIHLGNSKICYFEPPCSLSIKLVKHTASNLVIVPNALMGM